MSSVLSYEDNSIIDDASRFAKQLHQSVVKCKKDYEKKLSLWGNFVLWWEVKGFWNFSDEPKVLKNIDMYKKIYQNILTCMEAVANWDENRHVRLLELYEKLEIIEKHANNHINSKNKFLCQVAQIFLNNYCKMDYKLKRVEGVVLTKTVKIKEPFQNKIQITTKLLSDNHRPHKQVIAVSEDLKQTLRSVHNKQNLKISQDLMRKENLRTTRSDNQNLKNSHDLLHQENLKLKETLRITRSDNQSLKNSQDLLHRENLELKETLRIARSDNENLKNSQDLLQKENLELKETLMTTRSDNQNLKNSQDLLHKENLELKKTLRTTHSDKQNLEKSLKFQQKQNQKLKQSLKIILEDKRGLKDLVPESDKRPVQRFNEMVVENNLSLARMTMKMREKILEITPVS